MAKYVVSTLSADTRYAGWVNNNGINNVARSVLVKGGARVASRGKGEPVTHEGVLTRVSDEDAKFLSDHAHFKRHQEKGFVKIVNIARDPDTVAQAMSKDTGSTPKTPEDVADYSRKKGLGKEPGTELKAVSNK